MKTTKAGACFYGAVLGAGIMYFFDPRLGKRRRNEVVEKAKSLGSVVQRDAERWVKDLENRLHGAVAELQRAVRWENVDDDVVEARVRSKVGHLTAQPVQAHSRDGGNIVLEGKIKSQELKPVLRAVQRVPGVTGLSNQLEVDGEDPKTWH